MPKWRYDDEGDILVDEDRRSVQLVWWHLSSFYVQELADIPVRLWFKGLVGWALCWSWQWSWLSAQAGCQESWLPAEAGGQESWLPAEAGGQESWLPAEAGGQESWLPAQDGCQSKGYFMRASARWPKLSKKQIEALEWGTEFANACGASPRLRLKHRDSFSWSSNLKISVSMYMAKG